VFTVIVYDSKFGNTERIAEAIARGIETRGPVELADTTTAGQALSARPDLLLIGGPTQRRTMSPALRALVDALPTGLRGVPAATFDTRYRGATFLMGSAAAEAAKRIRGAVGRLVATPQSFFMARGGPLESQTLESGEIERAEAWGRSVASAVDLAASRAT
jgi:flavodoxin